MPKRTLKRNKTGRVRKLGFRNKMSTAKGRKTLKSRSLKGRARLAL